MMYRNRRREESQEHESLDRWLVSYADYMTLMFALFVVLYAMAIIKEEEYDVLSQTLGEVFEAKGTEGQGVPGEGLLTQNTPADTEFQLYGTSLLDEKGPELLDGDIQLSEVNEEKVGHELASMGDALEDALFDLIENGYAEVERTDDWLTIELNSGLMFAAGSATPTKSARVVMKQVYEIIGQVNNYIRIRGYTDNRAISTEIYGSNWELSVARAMAALVILQSQGIEPARMAIEGYGQYSPFSDNREAEGRADNRKVVVAISKYTWQPKVFKPLATPVQTPIDEPSAKQKKTDDDRNYNAVQVIELPSGGLRITTRKDTPLQKQQTQEQQNKNK